MRPSSTTTMHMPTTCLATSVVRCSAHLIGLSCAITVAAEYLFDDARHPRCAVQGAETEGAVYQVAAGAVPVMTTTLSRIFIYFLLVFMDPISYPYPTYLLIWWMYVFFPPPTSRLAERLYPARPEHA
ncbi:hypothetical protein AcV5_002546 [Taiwanofungus camphoratus]|nr:hypothetical protein AcV5_002546 [Antrodia cinnamomea]